tara:strand:+ start:3783 stop:4064 length:282 start_codon:yes stop_codon:yes gene_type:complete
MSDNAEPELMDLTNEKHTEKEIIEEAQKLCSFVLGTGKLKAEEVIDSQKLNHNNPVHLLGLTGTFFSDVIMKELRRMSDEIVKLKADSKNVEE